MCSHDHRDSIHKSYYDILYSYNPFLHYIPKKGLILSALDAMININLFILKILFFATLFTVCFLSSSHRNPETSEMSEAQSMPSRNSEPVGVEKGKQMNYVIK